MFPFSEFQAPSCQGGARTGHGALSCFTDFTFCNGTPILPFFFTTPFCFSSAVFALSAVHYSLALIGSYSFFEINLRKI